MQMEHKYLFLKIINHFVVHTNGDKIWVYDKKEDW